MHTRTKKILTETEYLELERVAETKNEFYNGEMFGLAGTSATHNTIVTNIVMKLGPKLKGKPCSMFVLDMRVKITKSGLYTYPDLVIACNEKKYLDDKNDTLLNPVVIIEVLSPSTEQYDRTTKFNHYRKIESFKEYILVSQEKIAVEHFIKKNDTEWSYKEYNSLIKRITLKSIRSDLATKDIYNNIEFGKKTSSLR